MDGAAGSCLANPSAKLPFTARPADSFGAGSASGLVPVSPADNLPTMAVLMSAATESAHGTLTRVTCTVTVCP